MRKFAKQMLAVMLAGSMAFSMWGCKKAEPQKDEELKTEISDSKEEEAEEQPETESEVETLSFTEFQNLEFTFYSGAGGWGTWMHIRPDGSFFGEYVDSDMGVTGEDYPNGTEYQCHFSGTFTTPGKVNDFTYSMEIQEISCEHEPGTEEVKGGVRYCYTEPVGLDSAAEILIYTPGAPFSEIPETYRSWVGYSDPMLETTDIRELPFYGLYNVARESGFGSYNVVDRVKEIVAIQEEEAIALETSLQEDSLSQAEYNETAERLYSIWDYALNSVWNELKRSLEEEKMKALTAEEREWIAKKEEAVQEAAADVAGGSMEPMVRNLKAAELTKARVYELVELLE